MKRSSGTGAGLGLAIVAEIVRLHEGRVEVGSAEGGGAVFSVLLRSRLLGEVIT